MSRSIDIECLNCGHHGSIPDSDLPRYGLAENTSLVLVTRRLICTECGGRAVRAFRTDETPPLAPQ